MSKNKTKLAVFTRHCGSPRCSVCLEELDIHIVDYGVEQDLFYYISQCKNGHGEHKYFVDDDEEVVRTKIIV